MGEVRNDVVLDVGVWRKRAIDAGCLGRQAPSKATFH